MKFTGESVSLLRGVVSKLNDVNNDIFVSKLEVNQMMINLAKVETVLITLNQTLEMVEEHIGLESIQIKNIV